MNSLRHFFSMLKDKFVIAQAWIRGLKFHQHTIPPLQHQGKDMPFKAATAGDHPLMSHHNPFSAGQMTIFWFIGMLVVYAGYLIFNSLDLLYLILAAWLISLAMESFIQVGQRRMPR